MAQPPQSLGKGLMDIDPKSIQDRLKTNFPMSQFMKEAAELIDKTNRPNVITVEQFMPFISIFTMDKERYHKDEAYRLQINRLHEQYVRTLNINHYEPTVIIRSHEDPVEELVLNRRFTRIKSDAVEGPNMRSRVPGKVSPTAPMTAEELLINATALDLTEANNTPEQQKYFAQVLIESALIETRFRNRNMAPEKRDVEAVEKSTPSETPSPRASTTIIDDDDD